MPLFGLHLGKATEAERHVPLPWKSVSLVGAAQKSKSSSSKEKHWFLCVFCGKIICTECCKLYKPQKCVHKCALEATQLFIQEAQVCGILRSIEVVMVHFSDRVQFTSFMRPSLSMSPVQKFLVLSHITEVVMEELVFSSKKFQKWLNMTVNQVCFSSFRKKHS